jgi:hypothetical protein
MLLVLTARQSAVKVNEETIEGLQSIEYKLVKNRSHIGAIGTDERIGVYYGMKTVHGTLRVASANATLDGLLGSSAEFTVSAMLTRGDTQRLVTFDACYMEDKSFAMGAGGHGETSYTFTATRVREE